jgi:hypothetical protein
MEFVQIERTEKIEWLSSLGDQDEEGSHCPASGDLVNGRVLKEVPIAVK